MQSHLKPTIMREKIKIELRKETTPKSSAYFVYVNDSYLSDTCRTNEDEANEVYEFVVDHGGVYKVVELIKSTEV